MIINSNSLNFLLLIVNAEESSGEKIQKDLLIPLVICVLISLLLLGVIIYQRRLILNNNSQSSHNCACQSPGQADQKNKSSKYLFLHINFSVNFTSVHE